MLKYLKNYKKIKQWANYKAMTIMLQVIRKTLTQYFKYFRNLLHKQNFFNKNQSQEFLNLPQEH